MRHSLKKLLAKFPFFLNKEEGSNFYNSQFVTNERFKDIYQSMFDVVESFRLDKRCFIFREQEMDYKYTIHFFVNFPNLKNVTCYKNDEVIYREQYDYEDFADCFEYSYNHNTQNDMKRLFYDNAVSENHRNDWVVDGDGLFIYEENGTIFQIIHRDEHGEIISGEPSSYIANYVAIDKVTIEFDILGIETINNVSIYYKGANVPLQDYINDLEPHHIKLMCENDILNAYVDEDWIGDYETTDSTECKFILNNSIIKFRNFKILTQCMDIIPEDEFIMRVETYDEIIVEKGYPENDELQGNIFDHDVSLDEIGALNNIPRREYLPDITPDLYPTTEPPYNNRLTEDDYHYMRRMIEYAKRLHEYPAPVLELWKLYGIESRMENRERLLLKVFDENRHDDLEWVPNAWEHKDKFCRYSQIEGIYFFVNYSTNTPTRIQMIDMAFVLVNSYGDNIADDTYTFDVYIDNELYEEDINSLSYSLPASVLPQGQICIIKVDCRDATGKVVGSVEFNVKVRTCDDSDFFVSTTGSDSNDGKTRATAFRTLQKACNSLQSDNSMIGVLSGEYTITNRVNVSHSCLIMGCGNVIIENTVEPFYFTLAHSKELELQSLKLKYNQDIHMITIDKWINNNITRPMQVIVREIDEYHYNIRSLLIKNLVFENEEISYETVRVGDDLSKLDGVIYDLEYSNGEIKYKEFEYVDDNLSPTDVDNLRNAITSLTYDNGKIKYTVLGDEI